MNESIRYRILENGISKQYEIQNADFPLIGLKETLTNNQIYKNDIILIRGKFKHTSWYYKTKRSDGKSTDYILNGYAFYQVVEGGNLYHGSFKLLKSMHDDYNKKGSIFYSEMLNPHFHQWQFGSTIDIVGNIQTAEKLKELGIII